MSRRAVLWIAFLLVHVGVAVLGWVQPNSPMGDVYLVYEKWSLAYFHGGYVSAADYPFVEGTVRVGFVGFDTVWVYPQLALVPMLLTWVFAWAISYTPAWAVLVTLVDAVAFGVLVGRARSRGRVVAAWFQLAFLALLGSIALYRIDAITVPLGILGCLWLVRRPWLGSVLLAAATWMKVWPAALLAAGVIALRRRLAVIGGALAVSAVTLGVVVLAGGGAYAFGFIGDQTGRDLQIEAPVATPYVWDAMLGGPSVVAYDQDLLTFEAHGPSADTVVAVMTPLLIVAVAAVAVLGAVKVRRGATFVRLFPALSLALVSVFIVLNKVGSPQYMVWLGVPLVVGLVLERRRWWRPALLGLGIAVCTQIVYPLTYGGLLATEPFPVAVITVRNALLVVMAVWSVVLVARVPSRPRVAASLPSLSAP